MTDSGQQKIQVESNDFLGSLETAGRDEKKSENQNSEVLDIANTTSIEKRDFSNVFARLKKSVRKKSVSIF